jgi:hypothetical protein
MAAGGTGINMTLEQFRTDLFEVVGEQTELDPSTPEGAARLDAWVNRAYRKVLFWRFPDGTQARFPCTDGLLFFQTVVKTGLLTGGTTTTVTLDLTAGAEDNQYTGWVVDVAGQRKFIIDYDASRNATVHKAFDTAPSAGTAYTLYKNFMRLCESTDIGADENIIMSPVSQFMAVRKITNIERFWDLSPAERTETFARNALSPGYPRQYYRRQNDIVFDYPAQTVEAYRCEYVRMPPALSADDDVPEVPEYFDDAILLGAQWRAMVWQQDNDEAYARKRDLQEFMTEAKQQGEMEYDRESGQSEVQL